jgi:hypothetical protein
VAWAIKPTSGKALSHSWCSERFNPWGRSTGTASPAVSSRLAANLLAVNYGTLYPALLKLEQEGSVSSEWGTSENNRRAKFYKLTRAGNRQLEKEAQSWQQATAILGRFLAPGKDPA